MSPFPTGLTLGLAIAIPVGPIGLLCLRRSLTDGRLAGFVSGLGAATADALYGLVAALGLTAITGFLLAYQFTLQLLGGLFLLYLGLSSLRSQRVATPAHTSPAPGASSNLVAAYASTFALTLTNPMTLLSFLGIFASLGASTSSSVFAACSLVLGVFLGSALWWLTLSWAAGWLRPRLEHGGQRILARSSGVVIAAFGVWQLLQLARHR